MESLSGSDTGTEVGDELLAKLELAGTAANANLRVVLGDVAQLSDGVAHVVGVSVLSILLSWAVFFVSSLEVVS
jgi:hypothetical protein